MFFYTTRKRKYKNGKRPSRTANIGYWKATGADTPITEIDGSTGFKKSLVFYLGQQKQGKKTDWMMHEYTLKKEEVCTIIYFLLIYSFNYIRHLRLL